MGPESELPWHIASVDTTDSGYGRVRHLCKGPLLRGFIIQILVVQI